MIQDNHIFEDSEGKRWVNIGGGYMISEDMLKNCCKTSCSGLKGKEKDDCVNDCIGSGGDGFFDANVQDREQSKDERRSRIP